MTSTPVSDVGTPRMATCPDNNDNAEHGRTARRLAWTENEDIRLINAWLTSSRIKKQDMYYYWANVAAIFSSTTPRDRRREVKHLKGHWHKISKKIARFDNCWCQVKAKYPSAVSDTMELMDKTWAIFNEEARVMYLEEEKHRFAFDHCWKALWEQPKWKAYISSLSSKRSKLSESEDCTSSSEDTTDAPDKEIDEHGCNTVKEKNEGKGRMPSSWELEKNVQCSSDLQNMRKKKRGEMTRVQLLHSDKNIELSRIEQLGSKGNDALISEKQPELLIAGVSSYKEFLPGSELLAGNSKFSEYQHGRALREDDPEEEMLEQDYNALDHDRATVREKLPGKETGPHVRKKPEHGRVRWGNVPERETGTQSCKLTKLKRKRKGRALPCLSEVQQDIKHAVDLQTMLRKDHEKMSEVQLRLSKEKLEFAKLKQQEAKDKKERTLHKNYSELLMADTSRFNDFQKAEYEKAVRRMGEMLFGKDDS